MDTGGSFQSLGREGVLAGSVNSNALHYEGHLIGGGYETTINAIDLFLFTSARSRPSSLLDARLKQHPSPHTRFCAMETQLIA